jgi:hypothetical protein
MASLNRGRSWPLGRAEVRDFLSRHDAPALSSIKRDVPFEPENPSPRQRFRGGDLPLDWIMYVDWNPYPSWTRGWGVGPEEVSLSIRDVPSALRSDIRSQLLDAGLLEFVRWLHQASASAEGWRVLRHRHAWAWSNGELVGGEIESHRLRS